MRKALSILAFVILTNWVQFPSIQAQDASPSSRSLWPAPLSNDECWQKLPKALEGSGEVLPVWARQLARELPNTTAAFLELDRAHRTLGPVDRKLRAAMRYTAAKANGSSYGMSVALLDAKNAGASEALRDSLANGTYEGWSKEEQEAIQFAKEMSLDSESISDAKFESLVKSFGDRQAACMVLHMAYANFQDRLLQCLGVQESSEAPLPASLAKFDPKSLVIETTPPKQAGPSNQSAVAATIPDKDSTLEGSKPNEITWLPYSKLQDRLAQQRARETRLRVPEWSEFADRLPAGMMDKPSKIVWYKIAFGYADELAVPFEIYLRTAGSEISKNWDRVFGNSIFWMVTDAMKCSYCMGHCEMNWEVSGLTAVEIAARSQALAENHWEKYFSPAEQHALAFAKKLTLQPASIGQSDLQTLRDGFGDQRALFMAVNASRYNYMTRISNGFQLTLECENVFWDYYRMPPPSKGEKTVALVSKPVDEPRPTPVTRPEMKKLLEDMKNRTPRIPLPELSAEEKAKAESDPRTFGYEGRLRSLYTPNSDAMGYLPFAGSMPRPANDPPNAPPRPTIAPDPAVTLGYPFKTRLFWIASRANNCQYCLGHQESKLLGAGMLEDQIAALDSRWDIFPEEERVAFDLAKRLTQEPYAVSDADIDACRKHYTDLQIVEMICSVAGNNAINRWKEGVAVPQSTTGGNFGAAAGSGDHHSYLTETSKEYTSLPSKVVPVNSDVAGGLAATRLKRPTLEGPSQRDQQLEKARARKPRFALVDEKTTREVMGDLLESNEPVPRWMQLLAHYTVAGKRLATGIEGAEKCDELSPLLRAQIAWVTARNDGAWYAASLAKEQLLALGKSAQDLDELDSLAARKHKPGKLSQKEVALLEIARDLAASPVVLTDAQVKLGLDLSSPKAVVQVVHYTTYRAIFNRVTEAAGL